MPRDDARQSGATLLNSITNGWKSQDANFLAETLEEVCTQLCLGGESFVRSIDVVSIFDELEECLNAPFAAYDLRIRVVAVRAVTLVADLVPRASNTLSQHAVMTIILDMASNMLLLQSCDPLTDEIVRCLTIVATDSRDWFLRCGGLRLFLDFLNTLGEMHRGAVLKAIVLLCGGVTPEHSRSCMEAANALSTMALRALTESATSNHNGGHVVGRDAELIHLTMTCFAHIIDRLFVTDPEAKELMGNIAPGMMLLINSVLAKLRTFPDPQVTKAIVLGLLMELHMAQPVLSLTATVEHGTLNLLAAMLVEESHRSTCDDNVLVDNLSMDAIDRAALSASTTLTFFDVVVALLPSTNVLSDAALLYLPRHKWEWEDDFRNHNGFDEQTSERVECEYQVQRRTRVFEPLVIAHASRPTTLHLLPLRQGPSVAVSRPIFRDPIPHGVIYREATVPCTCIDPPSQQQRGSEPSLTQHNESRTEDDPLTRTTHDETGRHDSEPEEEERGCLSVCCSSLCSSKGDDGERRHHHRRGSGARESADVRSRASRLQHKWSQRLATTPPSHDIREDVQRSPYLISIAANRIAVLRSLTSTVLPACVAVVSATVELTHVRHATIAILRILHIIRAAPAASEARTTASGMMVGLVAALAVAIRYAAVGAVEADRNARAEPDTLPPLHESRNMRFTGISHVTPQNNGVLIHAMTTRTEILVAACDALGVLMEVCGGEHIVPLVRCERLEAPLSEVCEYLEHIAAQERLDSVLNMPSPNYRRDSNNNNGNTSAEAQSTSADGAMHDASPPKNSSCLAHPTDAEVAARVLQALIPVTNLLGSGGSSPTTMPSTENSSDDHELNLVAMRLADGSTDAVEKWNLVSRAVQLLQPQEREVGLAVLTENHVSLLPAIADALQELEYLYSIGRLELTHVGFTLETAMALRRMLWRAVATQLTPELALPLIEKRPIGPVSMNAIPKDRARLVRRQILDRMDRHMVIKLSPMSGPRVEPIAASYGGTAVDASAEVHGHFAPGAPLRRVCDIILSKQRSLTNGPSVPLHTAASDDDEDPSSSRAFPTAPTQDDLSQCDVVLCFPSGKRCVAEGTIKLIDALYAYHPLAASFRNFIEWPLARKAEIPKPFTMWHSIIPIEYLIVRRRSIPVSLLSSQVRDADVDETAVLRGSGSVAISGSGSAGNWGVSTNDVVVASSAAAATHLTVVTAGCCHRRHLGAPACSPLHAFVDAAMSEPLNNPIAMVRSLGAIDAIVNRMFPSTTQLDITQLRLSSVLVHALRTLAPCFQLHFFSQLQLDSTAVPLFAPPSNAPSARSSVVDSPIGPRGMNPLFPRFPSGGDVAAVGNRRPLPPLMDDSPLPLLPTSLRQTAVTPTPRPPATATGGRTLYNASTLLQRHFAFSVLALVPSLVPLELRFSLLRRVCLPKHMSHISPGGRPSPHTNSPSRGTVQMQHHPRHKTKITVRREAFFFDASQQLSEYVGDGAIFDVEFLGEPGRGPGPTAEFFSLLSKEFRQFQPSPWLPALQAKGLLFPTPVMHPDEAPQRVALFQLLGQFIGRLLVEGRHANLPFHPLLWRAMSGQSLRDHEADNMACLDPSLAASLDAIARASPEDLEAMDLVFVLPGFDNKELIPHGASISVTTKNRGEFISLVRQVWLADVVDMFIGAFNNGIQSVFSPKSLGLLTGAELQATICGPQGKLWPSPDNFLSAVQCGHGYTVDSAPVKALAQVVAALDEKAQRDFLLFVAGTDCMPEEGLNPPLTIVRRDPEGTNTINNSSMTAQTGPHTLDSFSLPGSMEGRASFHGSDGLAAQQSRIDVSLPTVNTCFHYLKLPCYSTVAVLEQRLRYALNEGQGSFQLS